MKNTSAVTGPEHIYVCMIYFLTIDGILIVLTLIIFEFLALNFYKPRNCNLLIILFACTSTYMIYGHVPTYLGISISSTYLIYTIYPIYPIYPTYLRYSTYYSTY